VPTSVEGCAGLLGVAGAIPVSTSWLVCLPAKHNFKATALRNATGNKVAKAYDIKLEERQRKKKQREKKKNKDREKLFICVEWEIYYPSIGPSRISSM
jgi:hypothetical protein